MLNAWLGEEGMPPVKPLSGEDLMHAVSRGAAYYGLARTGHGVRIRGGVPRTYYVGIESAMPAVPGLPRADQGSDGGAVRHGRRHGRRAYPAANSGWWWASPRSSASSLRRVAQERPAGRPDRGFRRRTGRAVADGGELRAGETAEVVPVSFETMVTETGMLQLWCVARDGRRWKLEFNVRERVQG